MEDNNQDMMWYPMRVTYGRELSVKSCLDGLGVENFLPMQYKTIERFGKRTRKLLPAIRNLLFVYSTKSTITRLKHEYGKIDALRFMTRKIKSENDKTEIITVPDKQMENFLKVAKIQNESVLFLNTSDYLSKIGKRVKIINGPFTGVEGKILRIHKNKRVVVEIDDIAAVAVAFVPSDFMIEQPAEI